MAGLKNSNLRNRRADSGRKGRQQQLKNVEGDAHYYDLTYGADERRQSEFR